MQYGYGKHWSEWQSFECKSARIMSSVMFVQGKRSYVSTQAVIWPSTFSNSLQPPGAGGVASTQSTHLIGGTFASSSTAHACVVSCIVKYMPSCGSWFGSPTQSNSS